MKKLLYFTSILFNLILFITVTYAQELAPLQQQASDEINNQFLPVTQLDAGDILYSIQLNNVRDALGVTIINSIIYITSSDGTGSNYWDTYTLDGTYLASVVQGTSSSWGYRDLAYDGTNILASDDNDIDKIDPTTFTVVSTITNGEHSPHRGLAYDPNENVIYSTNYRSGPCIKIDATTGALIKELKKPTESTYGIAFDNYSNTNFASLWYAEPTSYGTFRISRVDTTNGNINFSFDLSSALPDSSLSGGLEIINNHPSYPNKTIAVVVEQHSNLLIFVDITDAPKILPAMFEEVGEFGGWDANGIITSGMVQYDKYLYSVDNRDLVVFDIDTNPVEPMQIKAVSLQTGNRIFVDNNFGSKLVVTTKNLGVNGFASFDISDPINPIIKSQTITTNHVRSMILGSYSYILEESVKKLFVYYMGDYSNPTINNEYILNGDATCLAIDNINKLLFVGCSGNNYNERGIHVFDITNPNTLVEKTFNSTNFDYPQKIIVKSSQKKIIVAVNGIDEKSSKLNCYDYSDTNNLTFKELLFVSNDNTIWDMKDAFNYFVVSIPNDKKIKTYRWDDEASVFLSGAEQTLESPLDIEDYYYSVPSSQIGFSPLNSNDLISRESDYERYFYITNGYASGTEVAGSEKTNILEAKKSPDTKKVTLTMSLSPPPAAANGCTITPAPGTYEYDINTTVNISAVEADGWIFSHWLGASGGMNTTILMDMNKNVTAVFKVVEPEKVILSMSISPSQATIDGCSTTPAIGSHEYDPNTTVDLSAHEANGWAFKEWEGVAGGNPTSILTDEDKTVTAVFQPTLTVSGDNQKYISCICDQKDSLRELGVINLCASEADDWLLNSITLKASGSGNEVTDVANVFASENSASAIALFTEDNGTVKFTFYDPVFIPKGDCIEVNIYYFMNEIPDEEILNNSSLDYHIETTSIEAVPVNYAPGLIIGDAQNDKLILAKVYNDDMEIFPTIQEAIDNTDNIISDIKEIHVCGGEYNETLNINKIVSLDAVGNGYEPSKIISDGIDNKLINIEGDGAAFCNLKFVSENIEGVYSLKNSTVVLFDSCQFNMLGNHKLVFDVDNVYDTEFNHCRLIGGKKVIKARNGNEIKFDTFDINVGILDNPIKDWSVDLSDYNFIDLNNCHTNYGFNGIFNIITVKVENTDSCLISGFAPPALRSVALNRIRLVNTPNSNLIFIEDEGISVEIINSNDSKITYSKLYNLNVINSSNVTIENNTFGIPENFFKVEPPEYGVSLINSNIFGSGNKPMANVRVINNRFNFVYGGIYALNQSNLRVQENKGLSINSNIYCLGGTNLEILLNQFNYGSDYGVKIENAEHIFVQQNKITRNFQGIEISGTKYGYVTDNDLNYNIKNISISSSKYLNVRNNNILNALGENTGIEIDSSNGLKLSFNNIINNNGDGIHISGNSDVTLTENNISENSGDELENAGTSLINAQNNFWGNASGPAPSDIVGNVDFSNYLQEAVGLIITPERDTLYLTKGVEDSVTIITNNISDYSDIYNVTITETQDWISNQIEYNNLQADTSGTALKVKFIIPEGATEENRITVNLISTTNHKTASVDFYVLPYSIELQELFVFPDSISLALNDSLQFSATGIDQYGNTISYTPTWSTDNGTINNSGLFIANNEIGDAAITATDSQSGISTSSKLFITNTSPILNSISIETDTVTLEFGESYQFKYLSKDQFGNPINIYPIWSATGGTISQTGIYIADSIKGEYLVKIETESRELSDTAIVIVTNIAPILSSITLEPDSIKLLYGESYQFNYSSTDQYGNSIMINPVWSATGGTISDEGVYTADSTNGTYFVKLEAAESSVFDSSIVIIDNLVNVEEIIPNEFSLAQNYPNPFNPSTIIKFGLKEEGYVTLEIFNIIGERVALPVDKNMKAGLHNVNVNFGSLASGIYIYRIDVKGKFTNVKKMLLLK